MLVLSLGAAACEPAERLPSSRTDGLAAEVRGLGAGRADTAPGVAVASALEQALFSQSPPGAVTERDWRLLRQLYERRRYAALWVTDSARREAALGALCGTGAQGLAAASYLTPDLVALLERATGPRGGATVAGETGGAAGAPVGPGAGTSTSLRGDELAQLDFRLTEGLLRSARDLLSGRARPAALSPAWRLAPSPAALDSLVLAAFDSTAPRAMLEGLHAPYDGHAELLGAWRRYRAVLAAGGWPAIPDGPALVPGRRDERVPLLRRRLAASGDFVGDTTGVRFDAELASALRRFQRRHGLTADGIAGATTLARLNVPVDRRLLQLEANLERFRWLPGATGGRHLFVDLAAGRLTAHAAAAETGGVAIVPVGAAGGDTLQTRRAPTALADSLRAVVLVPGGAGRAAELRLVLASDTAGIGIAAEPGQPPAPARGRRAAPPPALPAHVAATTPALVEAARLVLRGEPGWDSTRVAAALAGDSTVTVPTPGLALYLLQPTVTMREGAVHFLGDPAGADARIVEALRPPAATTPPPAVCRAR